MKNYINNNKNVLILEGLFFIKKKAIRDNKEIVKQTFKDIYKFLNFN